MRKIFACVIALTMIFSMSLQAFAVSVGQDGTLLADDGTPLKDKKLIALTFDDGPHSTLTPQLLDILKNEGVKATFYLVGNRCEGQPELVKRIYDEGHAIGSHTYSHKDLSKSSFQTRMSELNKPVDIIVGITGQRPTTMRPPYGAYNNNTKQEAGMPIILWSIDTLDWKYRNADRVYNSVVTKAKDGDIVLMHDIHATTISAAARIVPKLKEMGFTLVTVDELIAARGQAVNGQVYTKMAP